MCRWAWVLGLVLVGCDEEGGGGRNFSPPSEPAHSVRMEGASHAPGYRTPFLCHDASGGTEACPDDLRPEPARLSCDASGCHGDYPYSPEFAQSDRQLLGSDGPSCFTCHGERWSSDKGTP